MKNINKIFFLTLIFLFSIISAQNVQSANFEQKEGEDFSFSTFYLYSGIGMGVLIVFSVVFFGWIYKKEQDIPNAYNELL